MKKFILSVVALLGLVFTTNAQMIVDAEMFKANPNQFMGKVVTIKNVVYKGSSMTPGSPQGGAVSSPSGSTGAGADALERSGTCLHRCPDRRQQVARVLRAV